VGVWKKRSRMDLTVANCPSQDLAFTNYLYVNPATLQMLGGEGELYVEVKNFVYTIRPSEGMQNGAIGLNSIQRRILGVSSGEPMTVAVLPARETTPLSACNIEVNYVVLAKHRPGTAFDGKELAKTILSRYGKQYCTTGQQLATDFQGYNLLLTFGQLEAADLKGDGSGGAVVSRGTLGMQTQIVLGKAGGSPIVLTGLEDQTKKTIFKADFSFSEMGIGGLDKEFSDIFRRAFASRIFPAAVVKRLGVRHVKGMLLYGPPGTGKTLIARQIGKMLNGKEPKIVNGPEILSKFVGESEKNIRDLFADADAEMVERGDDSDLHIIIFDEIDSVCKQRGSTNSGTGVGDTVVNQLLSKIDGVNSLNNILLIGMTNRKDMIDEALLRPGRLEVHVEISLPDEAGRMQILNIHTKQMREAKLMAEDVDLNVLAQETKNFSGAEIEGLVKSAASFAFARQVQVDNIKSVDIETLQVTRPDFDRAQTEVKPAFGASTDDLENCARGGIVQYGPALANLMQSASSLMSQLQQSERTALLSVLLEGTSGAGKTALTATLALRSDFPFIKLVSPNALVGMGEAQKATTIARIFDDAHKSPLSLIVLDEIERLLEYVRIGPRFSNVVLQTLLTCIKKVPRKTKLIILATTSSAQTLESLELLDAFNVTLHVPALGHAEAITVLKELGITNISDVEPTLRTVSKGIPVKKLMLVVEMALEKSGALHPGRFATTLQETGLLD